jgi:hypothetical protein
VKKKIIILAGFLCFGSFNTAHALPKQRPLPNCSTANAACKEWKQAVTIMNEDSRNLDAAGSERGMKPTRSSANTKAMQACIRYLKSLQLLSTTNAEKACKEEFAS